MYQCKDNLLWHSDFISKPQYVASTFKLSRNSYIQASIS